MTFDLWPLAFDLSPLTLIKDSEGDPVEAGVVLEKGIDAFALEEVAVEDVVFDAVAVVHHKGDIDHQSGAVALTVATGVWLVGRETVIHPEFGLGETVGDEAAAGGVLLRLEIHEAAHETEVVVLGLLKVDGDVEDGVGRVGMHQSLLAAHESEGQEEEEGKEFSHGDAFSPHNVTRRAKLFVFSENLGVFLFFCYFCPSK